MMMMSLNSFFWTSGKTSKYLWIDTHEKVTSLLSWHAYVCLMHWIYFLHPSGAKSPQKTFGKGEAVEGKGEETFVSQGATAWGYVMIRPTENSLDWNLARRMWVDFRVEISVFQLRCKVSRLSSNVESELFCLKKNNTHNHMVHFLSPAEKVNSTHWLLWQNVLLYTFIDILQ